LSKRHCEHCWAYLEARVPSWTNLMRTVSDASEDHAVDSFRAYRHLLSQVLVTALLLMLLTAAAYRLLLT
jgi:hypothetical protein